MNSRAVFREIRARRYPIRAHVHDRSSFSVENATIHGGGGEGGILIHFSSLDRLQLFSIGPAGREGWIRAFSPCTKMTWPLLDRVGACKRFQILAEPLPVLSLAPSVRLSSKWRIRLKPRLISRYQSAPPNGMNLPTMRFNREADLADRTSRGRNHTSPPQTFSRDCIIIAVR